MNEPQKKKKPLSQAAHVFIETSVEILAKVLGVPWLLCGLRCRWLAKIDVSLFFCFWRHLCTCIPKALCKASLIPQSSTNKVMQKTSNSPATSAPPAVDVWAESVTFSVGMQIHLRGFSPAKRLAKFHLGVCSTLVV